MIIKKQVNNLRERRENMGRERGRERKENYVNTIFTYDILKF